jgi:branched-chain amino acid transport system ATP-binding protein
MSALLEARHLHGAYGRTQVLRGLNFAIGEGTVTTFLGANGAGKTSTLRAICGMINTTGEIIFNGKRIEGLRPDQIARLGIAHVPEGRGTFSRLSVEENLNVGALLRRRQTSVAEDYERIYRYFPRLKERRKQQAGTLSGGEQQMLAISRALLMSPRLILMDEPSFGLAPIVVREIFQIMRDINSDRKVSLLLVEQNASLALELADQCYVLESGYIVASGPSAIIKNDDALRRAYLGY